MVIEGLEPVLKVITTVCKWGAILFFLRGVLYFAGFRYNLPFIDDFFWAIIGTVTSWGVGGWGRMSP